MTSNQNNKGIPYPLGDSSRLNPAAFTAMVHDITKQIHPNWQVEIVKDLELTITVRGGYSGTAYLANVYDSCLEDPKNANHRMREYVGRLTGMEKMFEPCSPEDIVPIVKDPTFSRGLQEAHERNQVPGKSRLIEERLNETLVILYAVNSESMFRYMRSEDLAKIRVDAKNLRDLATKNLRRLLPPIEIVQHPKLKVSSIRAGGTFESSLLLFDEIWEKSRFGVSGDIVVGIPRRDTILVTDSSQPVLVEDIRRVCRRLASSGQYPVTGQLFIRRRGHFVEF